MYRNITIFKLLCFILNIFTVKCEKKYLTRCCAENKILIPANMSCVPYAGAFSRLTIYDRGLHITDKKAQEVFQLQENTTFPSQSVINMDLLSGLPKFNHYLNEDGILSLEDPNSYQRIIKECLPGSFCVADYIPRGANRNRTVLGFWIYYTDSDNNQMQQDPYLTIISMSISSFFFIIVLLVYGSLPELRNLHGLVLMAFVASMLAAFLSLATLQLLSLIELDYAEVCLVFSPMIYFFFLASFCWMNVMSFDIWWTFRGYAKARTINRRREKFKFFTYCVYSWGVPLAMTAGFVVLNSINVRHIPWLIVPKIPEYGCFITGGQRFVYLYIPMLIVLTMNWILFLMSGFNIWRLSRATAVLNASSSRHRSQYQRFGLYLKLSVVMGINWILEVVSSLTPPSVIWKISDAYNLLIGFNVFVIFICKRKIFNMLLKRIKGGNERPLNRWKGCSQRSVRSTTTSSSGCPMNDNEDHEALFISLNPKGN